MSQQQSQVVLDEAEEINEYELEKLKEAFVRELSSMRLELNEFDNQRKLHFEAFLSQLSSMQRELVKFDNQVGMIERRIHLLNYIDHRRFPPSTTENSENSSASSTTE